MRARATALALTIAALLALPAAALAGGWATVELSSTPDGLAPGEPWSVELQVFQHGRTPLRGVEPEVTISAGDERRTFAARPTGRPGVYRASVRFPHAGSWRYAVDDGFTGRHRYPAVQIGGAAAASRRGAAWDRLALAALAGLAAAGLVLLTPRRRAAPLGS